MAFLQVGVCLFICLAAEAGASVAYFGLGGKSHFDSHIKPLFADNSKCSKDCEVTDFSAFDREEMKKLETDQRAKKLLEKMKKVGPGYSIVYFDFNLANHESLEPHQKLIKKWFRDDGRLIIAHSGVSYGAEPTWPLSKTFLGSLKEVLIFGELMERDRLLTNSFFGPEMLTALRPAKSLMRMGVAPWVFVGQLSGVYQKRSNTEWVEHFQKKKKATKKLWLEGSDLL